MRIEVTAKTTDTPLSYGEWADFCAMLDDLED